MGEKNSSRRGLSRINCSLKEAGSSEPVEREVRMVRSSGVSPQGGCIELSSMGKITLLDSVS